jgi:hypothetical protein
MIKDVVRYFIEINQSIDPVWWWCRYCDMQVFVERINRNSKPHGCMNSGQYPFDVYLFLEKYSIEQFFQEAIIQLSEQHKDDTFFLEFIKNNMKNIPHVKMVN